MQKVKVNGVKVDATITLSADDWQFYSDMPGRDEAAATLNRTIERCLRDGNLHGIHVAMQCQSKFGATDTEGWAVLAGVLRQCGLDGDALV